MESSPFTRRRLLRSAAQLASLIALTVAIGVPPIDHAAAQTPETAEAGKPLPAWHEGELDIHHINTGRGDATFMILPDGTDLLFDASGVTVEQPPFSLPTRPDATRPPGEWVARYVQRVQPQGARKIDYVLLSHFHGDHMGKIVSESPHSRQGDYQLSGITEVAEHLSIAKVIDRGWPDYNYPAPLNDRTMRNYRKFLEWQAAHNGLQVERFQPGRNDQIKLLHNPRAYPQFEIRNIAANGAVWTGTGSEARSRIPPIGSLSPKDYPPENKLSLAFRISYGKFDYFTGGDLSANGDEMVSSADAWKVVETPVGKVVGPVDAMKANHHGSWDANSAPFLRALRPRVIVVPSRAEGHPAQNTYARMTSQETWPGPRDIFITNVSPATFKTTYNIEKAASTQGHVVIRVAPGGATYRVFVIDDSDEQMRVKAAFGPYTSN